MTIYDELRALMDEDIYPTFGVPATITRTVKGVRDKVQDRTAPATTQTFTGVGWLGTRKVTTSDGVYVVESTAKLNIEPQIGDRVTIGTRTATVKAVEVKAPDGGPAQSWLAILG